MDFCAFCDAALFHVWFWTRTLAKRLYCRAADAYYQTEHHCCTDNSLQCIMRSGMDSASDRVHFITSLVPAQLSDCNAIRRHHPSLEGRSLCGLIIWRALLSLGSATVYPCDTNAHVQIRQCLFVTTSLLERMLACHSYHPRWEPLFSTPQNN